MKILNGGIVPFFISVIVMAGCVSASGLLDLSRRAWSEGRYIEAVDYALDSYREAVKKNKEVADIENARNFLIENFPLANQYIDEAAKEKLEGTYVEKSSAWKDYKRLVDVNRRVKDSAASSFLEVMDFNVELQDAKEVSARIQYVSVLELMGEDKRGSYIKAYQMLKKIDSLLPGYRDIRSLMRVCKDKAMLVVAFSSQDIRVSTESLYSISVPRVSSEIYKAVRGIIESNDYPEFLKFTVVSNLQGAKRAGAGVFVELTGDVKVASRILDSYYFSRATVTWERSLGGRQSIKVTQVSNSQTRGAESSLSLRQSLEIEFYNRKYDTLSLNPPQFYDQFNNAVWMGNQVEKARSALRGMGDVKASMILWAEMGSGGKVRFLESALVPTEAGTAELSIESFVYQSTKNFINSDLSDFLRFSDLSLEKLITDKIREQLLSDRAVYSMFSNVDSFEN